MYAVIVRDCKGIAYLGECRTDALAFLDANAPLGAILVSVTDLDELQRAYQQNCGFCSEDDVEATATIQSAPDQTATQKLLDKLDELGINSDNAEDFGRKLREGGGQFAAKAKSLGARGMKAVGEGFVSLGELLRNGSVSQECGGDCPCHDEKKEE